MRAFHLLPNTRVRMLEKFQLLLFFTKKTERYYHQRNTESLLNAFFVGSCNKELPTKCTIKPIYRFFFLWRFLRSLFLRLCVAILWRLRFLPQGILIISLIVYKIGSFYYFSKGNCMIRNSLPQVRNSLTSWKIITFWLELLSIDFIAKSFIRLNHEANCLLIIWLYGQRLFQPFHCFLKLTCFNG